MKLLIVIANYRVDHLTIDCLHSLANEIASVPGTSVAVCENGSGDGSEERIQSAITDNGWDSWCKLTTVRPNLGFTGGNNVILRPALQAPNAPEYFLLLNADTVVRPNALKTLVDFLDQNREIGIAGSGQEYPDGNLQPSAFRFHTPWSEFRGNINLGLLSRLFKRRTFVPPMSDAPREVDWVSGATMMIRREVFRDIGVLDEGYYTHFEDIDFCFNARKAGWPIWYVPASRIMHLVGQSTGLTVKNSKRRSPSYNFETRRRYFLKNHGPVYAALADAGLIIGLALGKLSIMLGRANSKPPYYLRDSIAHSVFLTGFKVRNVDNPALTTEKALGKNGGHQKTLRTCSEINRLGAKRDTPGS